MTTQAAAKGLSTLTFDEVKALLADHTATLVDVLGEESFAQAHIPGARSLPLSTLREDAPRRYPDRDTPLVTYCAGFR